MIKKLPRDGWPGDFGTPYPWRMDDPQIAFPIFEKARELGVNLIGRHPS